MSGNKADNFDSRGTPRGSCNMCGCSSYSGGSAGKKCEGCGHPPGRHKNLSPASPVSVDGSKDASSASFRIGSPMCQAPGCIEDVKVDLNTGDQEHFCDAHMMQSAFQSLGISPFQTPGDLSQPESVSSSDSEVLSLPYALPPRRAKRRVLGLSSSSTPALSPSQPQSISSALRTSKPLPQLPPEQQCKVQGCNNPRYKESDGTEHEFCGRSHALEYKRQQTKSNASAVRSDMMCKTPGCPRQRCAMDDGSGYFDYCSILCRNEGQQPQPQSSLVIPSASTPNMQGSDICLYPDCKRKKYTDPANGRVHSWCGRTHANLARKQGIQPPSDRVDIKLASQQVVATVTASFMAKWAKGAKPTAVDCVFVITNTKLEQRWQSYKQTLSNQTVEEYYHGTKLTCDIKSVQATCTDSKCGVCGITLNGFDRRYIRKNINFQRFGHGFYLAPHSSKCHDYTQTEGTAKYRAMMVCDVCPGHKYTLKKTTENLTQPPQGCDSVFGETGQSLNYPEIVLYNPDSILPRYIVIYQRDGTAKIAK